MCLDAWFGFNIIVLVLVFNTHLKATRSLNVWFSWNHALMFGFYTQGNTTHIREIRSSKNKYFICHWKVDNGKMHHHFKTPNSIIHIIWTKEIYKHKSPFMYTNENCWIFQKLSFQKLSLSSNAYWYQITIYLSNWMKLEEQKKCETLLKYPCSINFSSLSSINSTLTI